MPGMPLPSADERTQLLAFLAQQRDALRIAAHGLDDEQATAAPSASALSIAGLIKHAAATERSWMDTVTGQPGGSPEGYADSFRLGPGETLAGVLAALDEAAGHTDAVVARLGLDHPVPVPKGVPWFPDDLEAWSVRWVLLHLVEELARHAGHADIVRESLDGATAMPLMAAAEGWPATPWLQPWSPPARSIPV